jgi:ADP-heptose:LPS heptosyltransferase
VVDNSGPLNGLAGRCQRYVLVRDLLGMVVRSPEDFASPATERLRVPSTSLVTLAGKGQRPQVAISWKTTNEHQGRYRNAPITDLARVLSFHDCDWHVAQHGNVADDLAVLRRFVPKERLRTETLHPSADMATFAGELMALDAVVTVDNSLLHLAGGLGIKTLGLLTIPAYWAWPAEGRCCGSGNRASGSL